MQSIAYIGAAIGQVASPRYKNSLWIGLARGTLGRYVDSQVVCEDWNTVFPNATSIAALLDRLTHHADITVVEGTSYRVRESELEAIARKKSLFAPLLVTHPV